MSRSGYTTDGWNDWRSIMYRGAVASAIRGKRGQAFLRELLAALEAMPERKLIAGRLERDGCYCTLGVIGAARGLDLKALDAPYDCAPEDVDLIDHDKLVDVYGVASALLREIQYENDEHWLPETDEQRWQRMHQWVHEQLKEER
jgi:hypothetical protein